MANIWWPLQKDGPHLPLRPLGGLTKDIRGIMADGGGGTVVEGNRIHNFRIIRGNRIRPLNGEAPVNDLRGIIARSVVNLTIDSKWVDVAKPDKAVQRGGVNFVQVFNNRTLSGTFLPVTIMGSSFHQGELTTDAELMYASL